jgi:tRNA (cytidine/uridine-2'-O-)-methyltransferase
VISKKSISDIPKLVFAEPRIAGNTGAAIRLCANTGSVLHLIEPLGFDLDDAKLRRSGLDYHDLTHLQVHKSFADFLEFTTCPKRRIFAFRTQAKVKYTHIQYSPDDYLLFGSEPSGLPERIWKNSFVSQCLYIPMRSYSRSINLANSAAIALYEAYRQLDFPK